VQGNVVERNNGDAEDAPEGLDRYARDPSEQSWRGGHAEIEDAGMVDVSC